MAYEVLSLNSNPARTSPFPPTTGQKMVKAPFQNFISILTENRLQGAYKLAICRFQITKIDLNCAAGTYACNMLQNMFCQKLFVAISQYIHIYIPENIILKK